MSIIIQKFGGTSVATAESRLRVLDKIREAKGAGKEVVVVVSAMGRKGDAYATDTLLELVGGSGTLISNREKDLLMSCGEIITTVIMSQLLRENGFKALALTGGGAGIITNNQHLNAEIVDIDTTQIEELLIKGVIPVVAGFQGRGSHNEVTTIGRGGSDTSASLLGEALKAEAIEIYTDVDGIMTTDPRICKEAQTIDALSYTEVFQMADSGAKVIHPRAVEIARRAGIPLWIKNTFTDAPGTRIIHYSPVAKTARDHERLITGIAHRRDRVQICVEGAMDDEHFFDELAEKGVSIDMINIFPERRVFTIDAGLLDVTTALIGKYPVAHWVLKDCCKVTVIGERMTGVPGVMARIIRSLQGVGVPILQTSDSLSTIACLIHEKDLEAAIGALHECFELAI